ncbi:MAG TPA: molybdopterin molybdenumtransferase MoeA, partial [Hellea balneolensis]|nr:molybdopterin molybdenumtransferase MoeA [Hellea balneolensis]
MAKLISLHEALAFIENNAHVLGHQDCKLEHAHNRVLAQDIRAATTLPPLSVSAMDGYAVNDDGDLAQGAALSVIGTSPAGNPFTGPIDKNQCVRIYTGGAVPPGANRVIMQENVTRVGDIITLSEPLSPALHIRAAGIDFHQGDRIADQGTRLDAYGLAQIAAANIDTVTVYKRPKVALIANGDELVKPGSELKSGQIISSNAYALSALIKAWGAEP